uniref:SCP domain-containing protein n=1 Tax=Mesocestoides corti TaxID=53468 RepID=A0A5K3FT14_MESCO
MNMLSYSEEMEHLAVKWTSKCLFECPSIYSAFDGTGMLLKRTAKSKPRFQGVGWTAKYASNYNYDSNICKSNCEHCKVVSINLYTRIHLKLIIIIDRVP